VYLKYYGFRLDVVRRVLLGKNYVYDIKIKKKESMEVSYSFIIVMENG
jgi:hypothetical protein